MRDMLVERNSASRDPMSSNAANSQGTDACAVALNGQTVVTSVRLFCQCHNSDKGIVLMSQTRDTGIWSRDMTDTLEPRHYRALFLSDVHLGTRGCQADLLLDFLRFHDAETIYLVGDIVDGWRLKRSWYWPQSHNDVVQKILRKGRKGARIVYLPGNHDEFLRDYLGSHFGVVEVVDSLVHEGVDGKRMLVIHGDQFDVVVRHAKWLAFLGDWAYTAALGFNTVFNGIRRKMGFSYWSLSAWAKLKVKNAVSFIGNFEKTLAAEAKKVGADGVVCGHIHHAAMHDDFGVRYFNTGDWVESCTAIVEHHDGRYEIVTWTVPEEEARTATASGEARAAA